MIKSTFISFLFLLTNLSISASKDEWRTRTVYQIITDRFYNTNNQNSCQDLTKYCGGTFAGITQNLDYIKNLGYDAIWISPVVANTEDGYHGYWAQNFEQINPKFGSEDDLKSLVDAAHSKDLYVMVDVVANHVGPVGDDFSQIHPLNISQDYHSDCDINDYNNQWQVENCRIAGLPDINQEDQDTQNYLYNWIKQLVNDYKFDGIRIDTVKHVPQWFWKSFGESAGVFQIGEVLDGDPAYDGPYQNSLDSLFNYPMFYTIRDVFGAKKPMSNITDRISQDSQNFKDVGILGLFLDNHDNARFLSQYSDYNSFLNALIFSMTHTGLPFLYQGTEQKFNGGNDPYNREILWNNLNSDSDLYKMISRVNAARVEANARGVDAKEKNVQDSIYVFQMGSLVVVLTNSNDQQNASVQLDGFSDNDKLCDAVSEGGNDCVTVKNGQVNLQVNGTPKVYLRSRSEDDYDDEVDEVENEVYGEIEDYIDELIEQIEDMFE